MHSHGVVCHIHQRILWHSTTSPCPHILRYLLNDYGLKKVIIKAWTNRKLQRNWNFKKCNNSDFLAFIPIINRTIKVKMAKNYLLTSEQIFASWSHVMTIFSAFERRIKCCKNEDFVLLRKPKQSTLILMPMNAQAHFTIFGLKMGKLGAPSKLYISLIIIHSCSGTCCL